MLLVPINDRARTWSEGDAPADWRDQLRRWDRLHHGRTALVVVAFVLVAGGLVGGDGVPGTARPSRMGP